MANSEAADSSGYRGVLVNELNRRRASNPRYSMRSFASALGVSPAFLSKVLRDRKNLSLETAIRICEALSFTDSEVESFCSSVRDRPAAHRMRSVLKTEELPVSPLSLDAFELISEWYHYAILTMTDCRGFNPKATAIAERLGIPVQSAELAIKRMVKLGVLKVVRGKLRKAETYIATPSGIASRALRIFHRQMIEKAMFALENQSLTERDITSVTFAIHPEKLPEVKEEIKKFRRSMARLLDAGRPTSVYQLNVQFFRLSEEKK